MDRVITYPGAVPLDTDILKTNRNAMVALAKLAAAILGTTTAVNGFAVSPSSPNALSVSVGPGEIYALGAIDGTDYGSLVADSHQVLKQGISLDAVTVALPDITGAGQSVNYLIQVAYQDSDTTATVLPYYNSANPAVAYSGPSNSGASQATSRKGSVVINAKAGTPASTGTQATPSPDAGFVGLWQVTIAHGQTTVTSGTLGSAYVHNAIYSLPSYWLPLVNTWLNDSVGAPRLYFESDSGGVPQVTHVRGGEAAISVQFERGSGATIGYIRNDGRFVALADAINDADLPRWGQVKRGSAVFTGSGTFTVPASVTSVRVRVVGGGAGGNSLGGGGGAGGTAIALVTGLTPGASISVTVGGGGGPGGGGGTSSFGGYCSASGGSPTSTGYTGGVGGYASGGDVNVRGGGGMGGGSSGSYFGGSGGNSSLGGGGAGIVGTTNVSDMNGVYGGGGAAGYGTAGNGGNGVVIVEW